MTPRPALTRLQRDQRKQSLLLASRLARDQAVVAFDELARRADALAYQVARARAWVARGLTWSVGSAVGSFALALWLRRVRAVRLLRWVWPAWRLWRSAAAAMEGQHGDARPGMAGPT